MTYYTRRNFGQAVRRAKRAGTLREYAKHAYGYQRMCSLTDGTFLLYKGPLGAQFGARERGDDDGAEYADPRDKKEGRP